MTGAIGDLFVGTGGCRECLRHGGQDCLLLVCQSPHSTDFQLQSVVVLRVATVLERPGSGILGGNAGHARSDVSTWRETQVLPYLSIANAEADARSREPEHRSRVAREAARVGDRGESAELSSEGALLRRAPGGPPQVGVLPGAGIHPRRSRGAGRRPPRHRAYRHGRSGGLDQVWHPVYCGWDVHGAQPSLP